MQPHQRPQLHDLPQHARERLAEMREHKFFTSDLSVNEFLLVKEVGLSAARPGRWARSIFNIGLQQIRQGVERGADDADPGALQRARARDGAHGRRGRRARRRRHRRGAAHAEHPRVGRERDRVHGDRHRREERPAPGFRGAENRPFTSDLSGQDFWTLLNAGYRPLGFVMGNCVYFVGQAPRGTAAPSEQELDRRRRRRCTTRASSRWSACRSRPRRSARTASSASSIDENNHTWGPSVLEFSAVGTAVVPIREDHHIERPQLILTGEATDGAPTPLRSTSRASIAARAHAAASRCALSSASPRKRGPNEAVHERPLGQRVPARTRRRVPPDLAGDGQQHLSRRSDPRLQGQDRRDHGHQRRASRVAPARRSRGSSGGAARRRRRGDRRRTCAIA